tara:strand:- start:2023 stop:2637 length:615 start_codon:yes stop_codon:yes gene_type:complete
MTTHSNKGDLKNFNLSNSQLKNISKYINLLKIHNLKTNLVGNSTLTNPLISHILDSIQISNYISNKHAKIADLGTGAGLPGLVLSICGYLNLFLIDSNLKKILFVKKVSKELNLSLNIINSRIENLSNIKFDYIVSRALANLDKLLYYSSLLSHKKTKLIFLKGLKLKQEIQDAEKKWKIYYSINSSISDSRGSVICIDSFYKK